MRILIACNVLTGGAGNVAQQLASLLSLDEDYQVRMLLLNKRAKPKYDLSKVQIIDRNEDELGIHLSLPKSIIRFFKGHYQLGKLINQWHPDVIISFLNSISVPLLISQWNTKTPIIVSERSNPYVEWKQNKWSYNLQWFLSYKRANFIVYQFHNFEQFFKAYFRQGKTIAIPNMLYKDNSNSIKKETENKVIKFVTLATLYSVKRIDLMIDIFSKVHQKHANTELHIYGDGPDRQKLEKKVSDMGIENSVIFYGLVTDSFSALKQKDIFLLTSEYEGFPNSIIEAMSECVVPIVFRFHDGMSEIIEDGKNGYLIPEGDVDMFVDKVTTLLENEKLRHQFSKNALSVNEKYDKENIIAMWKNVIETVSK